MKLLKDSEAEVRTAIAGQIPGMLDNVFWDLHTDIYQGFCALLDRDTLLNEIMPCVEDLVSDSSQHVRAGLGTQLSGLAPILGKDE